MIEKARALAAKAGTLERMEFVEARLTEVASYRDARFDLVICLDAPISYCYPRHEEVLRHLVRVARRAVVLSVSSRLGYLPYFFNPAQKLQYLADETSREPIVEYYLKTAAERMDAWKPDFGFSAGFMRTGLSDDMDILYNLFQQGKAPWPPNYCFTPDELSSLLTSAGLKEIRLAGPGALARSIPQPLLKRLLFTPAYRERFLAECYQFDSHWSVCGLGKDNLMASGVKATDER